jgi:uncharacterized SAM-binding protein YcdF (DUF218 family)
VDTSIQYAAQVLWDYLKIGLPLRKCDCVIAMGSHDLRVAEYAAELVLQGWAPLLVCSGGLGRLTRDIWDESEAEKFARVARIAGVKEEVILLEDRSTNTGENIRFSQALLKERGIVVRSALLVHKPYMERRALATAQHYWPELDAVPTSPEISLAEYPIEGITMEEIIQIMVGDFERILVYPNKGFQSGMTVSPEASGAFDYLKNHGFTKYLVA